MSAEEKVVREYVDQAKLLLGHQLVSAYWFGSRARGHGSRSSDYDILIETTCALTTMQRNALADVAIDIAADYGALIDAHFVTLHESLNPLVSHGAFMQEIHAHGVKL